MMHHDSEQLPDGGHAILTWRKLPEGVSEKVGGGHSHPEDPERMWGDVVIEIDRAGKTRREWLSWDHLSFEEDLICPLESHKEWTHANSLSLTPEGDWLVSFRLTDTVAIVCRETGVFKWKWGPGTLSHQHHASWLDTGRILIFDNGCHRRRGPNFSQVIEVDPVSNEIAWSYRAETLVAFYSFMVSGAQRLPNGNTLITEGATGRFFEVTREGETVWEYVSPFLLESQFGPTPAVFRAHRYAADDPRFDRVELGPERYEELTRLIARGEVLRSDPGSARPR